MYIDVGTMQIHQLVVNKIPIVTKHSALEFN